MIYVLIQIIIAIILIVLMGVLAYGIYNKNAREILLDIMTPTTIRKKTKILDGVYEYKVGEKVTFNTRDKSKGTYIDLSPSINQKGGSVYTYNFWLYFPENVPIVGANKTLVLFNKGSDQLVKYTSTYRCDTNDSADKGWFLVKNPLVRLDTNGSNEIDAIIVEFNSIENPDVFHAGANTGDNNCTGSMIDKDNNLIGIKELASRNDLEKQWNMITIIVSETSPDDDVFVSSNQAVVKLYLNGYAYLDKDGELAEKSTAMKVNNSDLHIGTKYKKNAQDNDVLPTGTEGDSTEVGISDLTYFNYALEDREIVSLFKEGCKKSTALIPTTSTFDDDPEKTEASLEIKSHSHPKSL